MNRKNEPTSIIWNDKSEFNRLGDVLDGICHGIIRLEKLIRQASIVNLLGITNEINIHGETVQKLDILAHEIFIEALSNTNCVAACSCEEIDKSIILNGDPSNKDRYVVAMDPIDGSSNIDVAVTIGSIFGIWRHAPDTPVTKASLIRPGKEQVAAVYAIYGSSTMIITATNGEVNGFTLNPTTGEFVHTHHNIRLPDKCLYYSVNEGNTHIWDKNIQEIITDLRSTYSLRYIGSLVADFHRNLLKGGVFLYPADRKNVNGKLRLMYEANPLAYIITQAGGAASDGHHPILEVQPESLHQRTPLFIGNSAIITEILSKVSR